MNLPLQLGIIGLGLTIIGILYAIIIYHWPIERTWVEVFIGVFITVVGEMLATAFILIEYGLFSQLWWIAFFPLTAFACTGLPMIIGQEIKLYRQRQKGENVENGFNGED